jgi:hypothetical protein
MICCKIVANYNDTEGNFKKLSEKLIQYGDFLWENGVIFFGDTEHEEMDSKKVKKIVRSAGYKECFVCSYDKNNEPSESSESINGWLADKLIKINYALYEKQSQTVFKNISKGLDILDEEIENIKQTQQQKEEGN